MFIHTDVTPQALDAACWSRFTAWGRLFIDSRLKRNLLSVSPQPLGPKSSGAERCTTDRRGRPRLYGQPSND